MSNMSRRPSEPVSVISTARVLRLGRIRFTLADRSQPGRPAGHRLPRCRL
jgi:hypothetical protein